LGNTLNETDDRVPSNVLLWRTLERLTALLKERLTADDRVREQMTDLRLQN
jgi:hypothetical protein